MVFGPRYPHAGGDASESLPSLKPAINGKADNSDAQNQKNERLIQVRTLNSVHQPSVAAMVAFFPIGSSSGCRNIAFHQQCRFPSRGKGVLFRPAMFSPPRPGLTGLCRSTAKCSLQSWRLSSSDCLVEPECQLYRFRPSRPHENVQHLSSALVRYHFSARYLFASASSGRPLSAA
jgi:hypothetical protein